ncbi:hypothetical protein E2C01_074904 [Portunus trituberculatus]|uniref:Uncharacterized protein n=1 Tax=Portunus trituberculatus TaxID=210409 RepID=A0A5B7IED7_PORTR|nr:hypothetical protein [Portunus trituberculatus]
MHCLRPTPAGRVSDICLRRGVRGACCGRRRVTGPVSRPLTTESCHLRSKGWRDITRGAGVVTLLYNG